MSTSSNNHHHHHDADGASSISLPPIYSHKGQNDLNSSNSNSLAATDGPKAADLGVDSTSARAARVVVPVMPTAPKPVTSQRAPPRRVPGLGMSSLSTYASAITDRKVNEAEALARKQIEHECMAEGWTLQRHYDCGLRVLRIRSMLLLLQDEEDVGRYVLQGRYINVVVGLAISAVVVPLEASRRSQIVEEYRRSWEPIEAAAVVSERMAKYSLGAVTKLQKWVRDVHMHRVGHRITHVRIGRDIEKYRHERRLASKRKVVHSEVERAIDRTRELQDHAGDWILKIANSVETEEDAARRHVIEEAMWTAEAINRDVRFDLVEFILQPKIMFLRNSEEPAFRADIEWEAIAGFEDRYADMQLGVRLLRAVRCIHERCLLDAKDIYDDSVRALFATAAESYTEMYNSTLRREAYQLENVVTAAVDFSSLVATTHGATITEAETRDDIQNAESLEFCEITERRGRARTQLEHHAWLCTSFTSEHASYSFFPFWCEILRRCRDIAEFEELSSRSLLQESFINVLRHHREDCQTVVDALQHRYTTRLPQILVIQRWARLVARGELGHTASQAMLRSSLRIIRDKAHQQRSRDNQHDEFLKCLKELQQEEAALCDAEERAHKRRVRDMQRLEVAARRHIEEDLALDYRYLEGEHRGAALEILEVLISRTQQHADYAVMATFRDEDVEWTRMVREYTNGRQFNAARMIQLGWRCHAARAMYRTRLGLAMEHTAGQRQDAGREVVECDESVARFEMAELFERLVIEDSEASECTGSLCSMATQLWSAQRAISSLLDLVNVETADRNANVEAEAVAWLNTVSDIAHSRRFVTEITEVEGVHRINIEAAQWAGRCRHLATYETRCRRDVLGDEQSERAALVLDANEERWRSLLLRREAVSYSMIVCDVETQLRANIEAEATAWHESMGEQAREATHRQRTYELEAQHYSLALQTLEAELRRHVANQCAFELNCVHTRCEEGIQRRRLEAQNTDFWVSLRWSVEPLLRSIVMSGYETGIAHQKFFRSALRVIAADYDLHIASGLGAAVVSEESIVRARLDADAAEATERLLTAEPRLRRDALLLEESHQRADVQHAQRQWRQRILDAAQVDRRGHCARLIQVSWKRHTTVRHFAKRRRALESDETSARDSISGTFLAVHNDIVSALDDVRTANRRDVAASVVSRSWRQHRARRAVAERRRERQVCWEAQLGAEDRRAANLIVAVARGKLAREEVAMLRDARQAVWEQRVQRENIDTTTVDGDHDEGDVEKGNHEDAHGDTEN
eukprot:PhM_4_TR9644/c0_g1_i1/m.105610